MTTNENYYEVAYLHIGGTIGAMGQRHKTIEDAINHVNYLQTESPHNKCHAKDRTYYINHIIRTTTVDKIELPVSL